jgi:hypothetical protein
VLVVAVEQVSLLRLLQNHMQIWDQELKEVMIYDHIELYFDVNAITKERKIA